MPCATETKLEETRKRHAVVESLYERGSFRLHKTLASRHGRLLSKGWDTMCQTHTAATSGVLALPWSSFNEGQIFGTTQHNLSRETIDR